ncbi:MAG: protein kinase [Pirellulaceae bacterium]
MLRITAHVDSKQAEMEHYLVRHAMVCEKTAEHPNVTENLTAAPVDGLWWVLDRWEEGETLAERLSRGALGEYELQFIMCGIAAGLVELNRCGVIRRELTPKSILLRESDDRPILTDMELAKLSSGKPTVSPEQWPDDPYRALEVCGGAPCDERADVYSWARIFIHAANGFLPLRGEEQLHKNVSIPNKVREVVLKAVSITPSGRPSEMAEVLNILRVWP